MALKDDVRSILEDACFNIFETSRGFSYDFIAKKDKQLLFIKVLSNLDAFTSEQATDLSSLSNELKSSVLLISENSTGGKLKEGAVYARFDIPAVNIETFRHILEGEDPLVKAGRGGFYVQIDGDRLRHIREDSGFSLERLARKTGVSRKTIQEYESSGSATVKKVIHLEQLLQDSVSKPINVFEVKTKLIEREIPAFEKSVVQKLNVLGFDVAYAKKSPFNVVAKEEKEEVISGLTGDHLKEKATILRRVGDLLGAEPIFILKKSRTSEIDGISVIDEKLLKKIRDLDEFLEVCK
ncbi:transcriptional regulator [Candidatus Undinarchaeota archaeon]